MIGFAIEAIRRTSSARGTTVDRFASGPTAITMSCFRAGGALASRGQPEVCMPQQRKQVVVIVEKSPQQRHKLPAMDAPLAQQVKQALDPGKGGKIVDVILEDAEN